MSELTRIIRWSFGLLLVGIVLNLSSPAISAQFFDQINLVTDDPTINSALLTDLNLKNPWGISFSPTSPFWISDNGTGVISLYNVDPTTDATTINALVVSIPGAGTVTGQVFNSTNDFNGDRYLFVSEDGTVSGWRGALGTSAETIVSGSTTNVYKGAALATIGLNTYLYAANFRSGTIDVIKGNSGGPDLLGSFTDPNMPSGYAPFNIQLLNSKLYVTYAQQAANMQDDVPGPGNGFVNVFDTNGNFLARVGSQGPLNSPWGLAIAPVSFGPFAGDLLVGNFGDGKINAFDLSNNIFVGQLLGHNGDPLVINGLWGLTTGNGGNAGSSDRLYFTAGPNGKVHGLFGVIQSMQPAPPTITTKAVSGVTDTSATLNGTVNANNASTTVTFQYGLTAAYGITVLADQSPVTGVIDTSTSKEITGLLSDTTYHYRMVASNTAGTTYGDDQVFKTLATPVPNNLIYLPIILNITW
jgi:uncharacterized protein (TIGR03118 family)